MAHWAFGDANAVLQSDVMPIADAEKALAATTREPMGSSVRWEVTRYREHHEGYDKRGFVVCERVLVEDVALTLLPADVALTGAFTLREPAAGASCPKE